MNKRIKKVFGYGGCWIWFFAAFFFICFFNLYAGEELSDREKLLGVWVVEAPYMAGKIHHEYEFRNNGTFRYDKWYLNKDGVPYNRADSLNNRIDREGKYSFYKDKDGKSVLQVVHIHAKGVMEAIAYEYKFTDNDILETNTHSGRHQREWKRKDGVFEWR